MGRVLLNIETYRCDCGNTWTHCWPWIRSGTGYSTSYFKELEHALVEKTQKVEGIRTYDHTVPVCFRCCDTRELGWSDTRHLDDPNHIRSDPIDPTMYQRGKSKPRPVARDNGAQAKAVEDLLDGKF